MVITSKVLISCNAKEVKYSFKDYGDILILHVKRVNESISCASDLQYVKLTLTWKPYFYSLCDISTVWLHWSLAAYFTSQIPIENVVWVIVTYPIFQKFGVSKPNSFRLLMKC